MLQKHNPTEAIPTKKQGRLTSSMINSPQPMSEESQKAVRQVKITKDSYWSWKEQQTYLNILKEHMPMITSTEYRRKHRIFKKISTALRTRTAVQVKSHHQKLEEKFRTIPKIIEYLQRWLQDTEHHFQVAEESNQPASSRKESKVDASIQTDPPYSHEIFFEPEYLENYIQSLISFKKEFFVYQ